jgi:riboflavin kinase / FMN adenylyltransferase
MHQALDNPLGQPRLFDGSTALPAPMRGSVIAIGNFDGVHRGHVSVIARARDLAGQHGVPCGVLTFEPHPRAFFQPQPPLFRLASPSVKLALLARQSLDLIVTLPFGPALAGMRAVDFEDTLLIERLGIGGVVVGDNFRYGHARQGTLASLRTAGQRHGFAVETAEALLDDGQPVSSSRIRALLGEGDVEKASALLGYRWLVSAEVRHGDKRGRDLGFPTANLVLDSGCGLKHGIYAVRVGFGSHIYDAVASFGRRPTFDDGAPRLEVFIFDFSSDLYGQVLDVEFVGWIRPELKFDSIDALITQMHADCTKARQHLHDQADTKAASLLEDRRSAVKP